MGRLSLDGGKPEGSGEFKASTWLIEKSGRSGQVHEVEELREGYSRLREMDEINLDLSHPKCKVSGLGSLGSERELWDGRASVSVTNSQANNTVV